MIDKLYELAFPISKIEEKVTTQISPLIDHLVKYFRYHDPNNKNGYLLTIYNISRTICALKFKSKIKINSERGLKWINFNNIDSEIITSINYFDMKYSNLKIIRNEKEVLNLTKTYIKELFLSFDSDCFLKLKNLIKKLKEIEK